MSRYKTNEVKKLQMVEKYTEQKYIPQIPLRDDDIYVVTQWG